MGTRFSELPDNDPLVGSELVCLSQSIDATLTSVKATIGELGDFFSADDTFVTNVANNATFVTELITNTSFIGDLAEDATFITNIRSSGVLRTVVETEASDTYTLELADGSHKWKSFTSATPVTVTIPPQASVAWEDYTYIELEQAGDGAVTIEAGVGVTINYNENLTPVLNGNFAVAGLKRTAENVWNLFGNLVPA
jgi:hypothetical protein